MSPGGRRKEPAHLSRATATVETTNAANSSQDSAITPFRAEAAGSPASVACAPRWVKVTAAAIHQKAAKAATDPASPGRNEVVGALRAARSVGTAPSASRMEKSREKPAVT